MFSQEITPCWCIAEKLASWLRELLKYIICASGILMWKNLSQLTSCWWGTVRDKADWCLSHKNANNFHPAVKLLFFFFLKSKLKLSYIPFHFRLSIFLCQTKLRAETVFFLSLSTCSETFPHTLKYNKGPSHFISSHIQSCVLLFL